MASHEDVFIEQLAGLITIAVAHMQQLQQPPSCDCSERKAGSRAFRQEMENYSLAIEEVLHDAFTLLHVRHVRYDGRAGECEPAAVLVVPEGKVVH